MNSRIVDYSIMGGVHLVYLTNTILFFFGVALGLCPRNFYINKNATLPILKMELILDGRHDFRSFHEKIQNSNIYFSMTNIEDGFKKLCRRPALCIMRPDACNEEEEYYLAYQFSERETNNRSR